MFDKQTLKDKRSISDDSIVRGNIAKGLVYLLKIIFMFQACIFVF